MPYYRHTKDQAPLDGVPFATVQEARDGIDPKLQLVTFEASWEERQSWQLREAARFESGEYIPVPWVNRISKRDRWEKYHDAARDHYAHLSLDHAGLIAYTKSDEHGIQDRQTRVKPGKYLDEFYPGEFSADIVADYIAKCKAENTTLQIARDPDTIAQIYMNGPNSCMGGEEALKKGSPFTRIDRHPTRVYGDSDLAVAYLGDPGVKVTARCIVWPDKKRRTRDYGDPTLRAMLTRDGYTLDSIDGARIRVIEYDSDRYLMPYVDSHTSFPGDPTAMKANREGDYWRLVERRGEIDCNETQGWVSTDCDEDHDDPDEDEDNTRSCDHCQRTYDPDSQGSDQYCQRCDDNRLICESCQEDTWDGITVGNDIWCETCVDQHTVTCQHFYPLVRSEHHGGASSYQGAGSIVQCENTWIEQGEFTPDEQAQREHLHTTHLCRQHADGMQACSDCAALFPDTATQCVHCGLTVRCSTTSDLLAATFPRYFKRVISDSFGSNIAYWQVNSATEIICVKRDGETFGSSRTLERCLEQVRQRVFQEITLAEVLELITTPQAPDTPVHVDTMINAVTESPF